jgi:hypothetical protein
VVRKVGGFKEIAENLHLMLKKPGQERDVYGEITRRTYQCMPNQSTVPDNIRETIQAERVF